MRDSEGHMVGLGEWSVSQVTWVLGGFGGSGGSVWVMGEKSVGQWKVVVISFQKMYGLYGLKHHIVEKSGDVTDAGRRTREDRATHPMDSGWLSFAILCDQV